MAIPHSQRIWTNWQMDPFFSWLLKTSRYRQTLANCKAPTIEIHKYCNKNQLFNNFNKTLFALSLASRGESLFHFSSRFPALAVNHIVTTASLAKHLKRRKEICRGTEWAKLKEIFQITILQLVLLNEKESWIFIIISRTSVVISTVQ